MKHLSVFKGIFLTALIALLWLGCVREVEWEPEVIARVGDRALTASEVDAWEASLRQPEVAQDARSTYIRHWVEEELLYQEAIEQGLIKDAWVLQRLDEIKRQLLVSRLLEYECRKLNMPSPQIVEAYFKQNSSEFIWPCLHLVVDYWRAEDRQGIERLRSNVQRGRQTGIWTGKAGSLDQGRITVDGPGSAAPEVWTVVSRMSPGEVSPVRRVENEYWVFKLIDRREKGEQQGIEDVRDEIVMRLMEEARRNIRGELVRNLVDKYRHSGELYWSTQPRVVTETENDSIRKTLPDEG